MSDASEPTNAGASKAKKILVVDDNADVAEGLREILESAGHTAVVATGSVQALALGSAVAPDVVISDIELPVMDGYELALHLRARPELSNTLFIALTGYGQAHDPRHSRESGFQYHFVKPVDIDRLLKIVADGA
ncbi:MAG TPA: response regulator [Polyangia bacterium]|nr:response regulator [Polyangia bacterium]